MEALSILNTETTPHDSKDPDLTEFDIKGWNLVVRPVHVEGKTKGGIILTDKTQGDASYLMNVGKVLKMGTQCFTQEDIFNGERWCEVGDYVLIPKLTGQKVKYKGVPLTIISCDRIIATIKDPKDIDPNFNITGY